MSPLSHDGFSCLSASPELPLSCIWQPHFLADIHWGRLPRIQLEGWKSMGRVRHPAWQCQLLDVTGFSSEKCNIFLLILWAGRSLGTMRDLPKEGLWSDSGKMVQPLGGDRTLSLQVWPGTSQHEKCPRVSFELPTYLSASNKNPQLEIHRPRFWGLQLLKTWTQLTIQRVTFPHPQGYTKTMRQFLPSPWMYSAKRTQKCHLLQSLVLLMSSDRWSDLPSHTAA